jgi:DNA ligase-1
MSATDGSELMIDIIRIINELKEEPSTNKKKDILVKNYGNELFKKVLFYTYNRLYNYGVKKFDYSSDFTHVYDTEQMFDLLDSLRLRKITGNDALKNIYTIVSALNREQQIIFQKIIDGDLDCGINIKTINKVWEDLIPSIPYMRCSDRKKIKNIKYPAIIQRKADGVFLNVVVGENYVEFITRNGLSFTIDTMKSHFQEFKNLVFHGELVVVEDGKELPRKIGNGLITSFIKKESTLKTLEQKMFKTNSIKDVSAYDMKAIEFTHIEESLKFLLWDVVEKDVWEGQIPNNEFYVDRFLRLEKYIKVIDCHSVSVIESEYVKDFEEALDFYNLQREKGYEGAVLKNLKGEWADKTSTDQIKMKAEYECDLVVVGVNPGTGKYSGGIGSLDCESSDGFLKVNIPGLTALQRGFERVDKNNSAKGLKLVADFDINLYIGCIVTVKFNDIIKAKDSETWSLFLPEVLELPRPDKDVADSLLKIQEITNKI